MEDDRRERRRRLTPPAAAPVGTDWPAWSGTIAELATHAGADLTALVDLYGTDAKVTIRDGRPLTRRQVRERLAVADADANANANANADQ